MDETTLQALIFTAAVFGLATLSTMLAMVAVGYWGLARFAHGFMDRYAQAACGGAIAPCGAAVCYEL